MQYLLTEEEYKDLVPKDDLIEARNALVMARKIIFELAAKLGVDYTLCGSQATGKYDGDAYCDGCPLDTIGQVYERMVKGISLEELTRGYFDFDDAKNMAEVICPLKDREYGK